jgi:hypothetical protein
VTVLVSTDPAVFDIDDNFEPAVGFMDLLIKGRHLWDVDPASEERAALFFAKHSPLRAPVYRQIMQKGFAAATLVGSSRPRGAHITSGNVHDAVSDLTQPAVVIVENATSDGLFIRAVFQAFQRGELLAAIEQSWLVVRQSGGGGEFTKVASDTAEQFRVVVRVCGFLDSDRLIPGSRTQAHDKAEEAREIGIDVHVLELREAENYIPPSVLRGDDSTTRRRQTAEAFAQLTPEQRGHFDMKRGFKNKKGETAIPPEQQTLYASLGDELVEELADGFGGGILRWLAGAEDLTAEDFAEVGPGVVDEIRELIRMIDEVI